MSDDDNKPINPNRAVDALITMAPQYAEAKANRIYLEEYRKTLKALIMRENPSIPISAQEREAYADPRYQQHLKALQTAIEQEETLRWRLVAAEARIEVWRSQEASNRMTDRVTR